MSIPETRVDSAAEDASEGGVEREPQIANLVQVVVHSALLQQRLIRAHVRGRVASDAASAASMPLFMNNRVVCALDLHDAHEASGAADKRARGEVELADRLEAALVEDARAVCYSR